MVKSNESVFLSASRTLGTATSLVVIEMVLFALLIGIYLSVASDRSLADSMLGGGLFTFWRVLSLQPLVEWVLMLVISGISSRIGAVRFIFANLIAVLIVSLFRGGLEFFIALFQSIPGSGPNIALAPFLVASSILSVVLIGVIRKAHFRQLLI